MRPALAVLALLAVAAPRAGATAVNLVANGGFDAGASGTAVAPPAGWIFDWTMGGSFGSGPGAGPRIIVADGVTANTARGYFGDVLPRDPFAPASGSSGTRAAYFVDDQASEWIDQTITLSAGTTYEVGYDVLVTASGARNPGLFTLVAALGGVPVATLQETDAVPVDTWLHVQGDVVAPSGGPEVMSFSFVSAPDPVWSRDIAVSGVSVTAVPAAPGAGAPDPVAAPSTVGCFALGIAALWRARRRVAREDGRSIGRALDRTGARQNGRSAAGAGPRRPATVTGRGPGLLGWGHGAYVRGCLDRWGVRVGTVAREAGTSS